MQIRQVICAGCNRGIVQLCDGLGIEDAVRAEPGLEIGMAMISRASPKRLKVR